MELFIVMRTRGGAWNAAAPLEGQVDWDGHARFMNGLEKDGFVLLGGPVEGTQEALLVVAAESREEIDARLAADPWSSLDILRTSQVGRWDLRLGRLAGFGQ